MKTRANKEAAVFPGAAGKTPDNVQADVQVGAPNLDWIYAFWAGIRDYVYVREEDNVVILPPNKVYKTNSTGIQVLRYLDAGGRFEKDSHFTPAMLHDVGQFMSDIRDIGKGMEVTTDMVPYDFDFTRLPILGEIAVTYRCNNSCRFCYAGCGSEQGCTKGHVKDSSLRDLKKIIKIFRRDAKIPFFSFTGGEPLLRDDLERMIVYATSLKLRVNLITNATLVTPERAHSLYAAGLRTAQVSVESPEPAVHDALCGVDGAWERTMCGIRALRGAGITVQTNSTLTKLNRESLADMPEFLASIDVGRFSMNLYIPQPDSPHAAELFVPYSETGSFVDDIREKAMKAGLVFFWYSPTPLCIYNPVARGLGNKSCAAADGLISVDPAGNVLPCSSYPEPLGNLLEEKFSDVWFSGRAAHFKQKRYAPDLCVQCPSFVACQAACPLYWAYAGYGELEKAKMEAV
ncbi:MAG: radical SAM protein [Spirochaetaceae bacterium]|nr:radical SAM protein [Spirochaetaceae bacterium]